MNITLELTITHEDGTDRDDPERVADIVYWQLLEGRQIRAGEHGNARYVTTDYHVVASEPEFGPDGNDLDVYGS